MNLLAKLKYIINKLEFDCICKLNSPNKFDS